MARGRLPPALQVSVQEYERIRLAARHPGAGGVIMLRPRWHHWIAVLHAKTVPAPGPAAGGHRIHSDFAVVPLNLGRERQVGPRRRLAGAVSMLGALYRSPGGGCGHHRAVTRLAHT